MGGAVSSGRDNNELIDNLMGGNYIRTQCVERVFRALDRADYMTPEARDQAYKDLAWRNGPLHMSAPCIYSEVMEGLELRPGLSFLNVGSGTGYLSTLVGLILGSGGISHGIEVHPIVVEYATKKMSQFLENSPTLDEFDFCEPKFYGGNGLCVAPLQSPYDRVYCGAGCPEEYQNYFKQLIKIGGLLVMPLNDNLIQVRRVGETEWVSRSLLNVSFATLRVPTKDESSDLIKLDEQTPPRLQVLSRSVIRGAMRAGLLRRHPELRESTLRPPPAKRACPRRICIPIEDDSDVEGLNALHDLDRDGGAREMNALLSLVLSMGQNRVAGALRFDQLDSPADSSSDDDDGGGGDDGNDGDDGDDGGGESGSQPPSDDSPSSGDRSREQNGDDPFRLNPRSRRGLLTFEFRGTIDGERASATPPSPPPRPSIPAAGDRGEAEDRGETEERGENEERGGTEEQKDAKDRGTTEDREFKDRDTKDRVTKDRVTKDRDTKGRDTKNRDMKYRHTKERREMKDDFPRSGPSRTTTKPHNADNGDHADSPGVPAEVEIYLGKAAAGTSSADPNADMDWEGDADSSADETEEETNTKEDKRQKLDSGIGEETTPTSDSSPVKSDSKTDESDADGSRPEDSLTDDVDDKLLSRRRLQKRGRCPGARSPSSTECSDSSDTSARRAKRRARVAPGPDARRVRLSVLMKRGVKELPLPHALKKYVNLGRCFEF